MTWTDRDDHDESFADHIRTIEDNEPRPDTDTPDEEKMMGLHLSIRNLLDTYAAEVARDIDNTECRLRAIRSELSTVNVTLERLRIEERAIVDARDLLQNINGQE